MGAHAQTVKAIASDHHWRATHHGSIIGVGSELAALAGQSDLTDGEVLRHGLATARSLHQHFYEDDLPDGMVAASVVDVNTAIELMQELFAGNGAEAGG